MDSRLWMKRRLARLSGPSGSKAEWLGWVVALLGLLGSMVDFGTVVVRGRASGKRDVPSNTKARKKFFRAR
jgi:hypothetical protein